MVSLPSRNIEDTILTVRNQYMTQMYEPDPLHKTIKSMIDEALGDPERDTSKLTAMIIAEVNNG